MRFVGQYELVSKLGEGGMAEVWKGIRRTEVGNVSKTVAIKLIAGHSSRDLNYQRMFMREARVSMLLSHSTIAQVFDVGMDEDQLYMAMEFVNGLNLRELLQRLGREPLDFHIIAYIVGEMLRALAYAHEIENDGKIVTVIHRDISPHNVMVTVSGEVKVTDFGIASISAEETTGSAKGKLQYMPREQLLGDSRKPTVDLFAVGAVLHELLESKPFRAAVDSARMYGMVLSGGVPELMREGIPPPLRLLHDKLLEPEASDRPQSAHEALEQLYAWAEYRNASMLLSALVKRAVIPVPKTSSKPEHESRLTINVNDATLLPSELETIRGTVRALRPETESTLAGLEGDIPTQLGTQLVHRGGEELPASSSGGTEVAIAAPTGSLPIVDGGSRWRGVLAVSIGAVLIAVIGSVAFSSLGDRDEVTPTAAVDSLPVSEDAPAISAKTGPKTGPPAPTPTPTLPVIEAPVAQPADSPPQVEPEPTEPTKGPAKKKKTSTKTPASESVVKADPPDPPKPSVAPSEVTLLANDYSFSYVKLDGKHYTLEPRASAKLTPGSYTVHMRLSDDEEWQKAGTLHIEAGKSYKVLLTKPVGLAVQTSEGG